MITPTRRPLAVLAATALAAIGLAACGGDDASDAKPTAAPKPTATMDPMLASLVGPGCAAYAAQAPTGAGSVQGMSIDPLATATSHNPLLKTLSQAISGGLNKKVKLADTLNGGDFTVFAPVDSAFSKMPVKTLDKYKTDRDLLVKVLTYHVVAGQLSPAEVVGSQTTVQGQTLKVTGKGSTLKVNGANVICGGVHTANATVYMIDRVLTPPAPA